VMVQVLDVDPARYRSHPLHGSDRIWKETNCAADLWIEALHSLGFDPVAALGFTLSADFDGDQWRMFTFPAEDLRLLFGIEMDELNVWRPLVEHLVDQLALRRLVVVDVDAWYLPDTAGLTYRCAHQKTSVMVQMVDLGARRLGYFHNRGYYVLEGEDFSALLEPPADPDGAVLPPYALSVRLDGLRPADDSTDARALALGLGHLARRPQTNPVARLRKRIDEDLPWLRQHDLDTFHRYAFGTVRQCGANAELAADFASWLDARPGRGRAEAAPLFTGVAAGMKSIEFSLARAARGRSCDLEGLFAEHEVAWDEAMDRLALA